MLAAQEKRHIKTQLAQALAQILGESGLYITIPNGVDITDSKALISLVRTALQSLAKFMETDNMANKLNLTNLRSNTTVQPNQNPLSSRLVKCFRDYRASFVPSLLEALENELVSLKQRQHHSHGLDDHYLSFEQVVALWQESGSDKVDIFRFNFTPQWQIPHQSGKGNLPCDNVTLAILYGILGSKPAFNFENSDNPNARHLIRAIEDSLISGKIPNDFLHHTIEAIEKLATQAKIEYPRGQSQSERLLRSFILLYIAREIGYAMEQAGCHFQSLANPRTSEIKLLPDVRNIGPLVIACLRAVSVLEFDYPKPKERLDVPSGYFATNNNSGAHDEDSMEGCSGDLRYYLSQIFEINSPQIRKGLQSIFTEFIKSKKDKNLAIPGRKSPVKVAN